MNGPIVAIACVSSQILHCHPLRPIQSNHRINANGRFESIRGLDVNNLLVEAGGGKKKRKTKLGLFAKNSREAQKSLGSRAAMGFMHTLSSLQSDHQIWAMNYCFVFFPDWNECRVSLEQDNSLSPHFKLLLFICHVRYEYIQVACNNRTPPHIIQYVL